LAFSKTLISKITNQIKMNNNITTTRMSLLITTMVPSVAEQAALAVYRQFVGQCDAPERRTMVNHTLAYGFFTLYALGLPLQLCILPANVRLARHRSAFLLLLYIVRFGDLEKEFII
jgi:hypothetical protein